MNKSATLLSQVFTSHRQIKKLVMEIFKPGEEVSGKPFYRITLFNAFISKIDLNAKDTESGKSKLEEISFDYEKLTAERM
jgi:type VI secretion system Hcp family effector